MQLWCVPHEVVSGSIESVAVDNDRWSSYVEILEKMIRILQTSWNSRFSRSHEVPADIRVTRWAIATFPYENKSACELRLNVAWSHEKFNSSYQSACLLNENSHAFRFFVNHQNIVNRKVFSLALNWCKVGTPSTGGRPRFENWLDTKQLVCTYLHGLEQLRVGLLKWSAEYPKVASRFDSIWWFNSQQWRLKK